MSIKKPWLKALKKLKEKLAETVEKGELTAKEMEAILNVEAARFEAILVDEYTLEEYKNL